MPSLLAKSAQRFNVGASFDRLAFDSLFLRSLLYRWQQLHCGRTEASNVEAQV